MSLERVCIFVDAGYFYDQGAIAISGRKHARTAIQFDPAAFFAEFSSFAERLTNGKVHRIYWYDGAKNMVPDDRHIAIDSQPFVKLRLGRLTLDGGQKGVDTLMVRDLMVLSQERTLQQAVVLTGDDDLREGIEYAQDRGVLVYLVGIKDSDGLTSQSEGLSRIVDQVSTIEKSDLTSLKIGTITWNDSKSEVLATSQQEPSEIPADVLAKRVGNAMIQQIPRERLESVLDVRAGMLPADLDKKMFSLAWTEYGRTVYFEHDYKIQLRNSVREVLLNFLAN
jgi:uncharacterized LabA/DUF88 family protein